MSYEVQPEFPPAPQLQVYGDAPNRRPSLMSITTTEVMTWTINPASTKTSI
jgi:hypothetical protein